jgi:HSP20 family protein
MKRQKMIPIGFERVEVERLRQKFERLFAVLEDSIEAESLEVFGAFLPPVDLREGEKAIFICIEIAGVKPDEIILTVNSKEVYIEGIRKTSKQTQKAVSHFCCERQYGKFRRVIQLRWAIDLKGATAELKDGLLEIYLPKLVDRRGKNVKVPIKIIEGEK